MPKRLRADRLSHLAYGEVYPKPAMKRAREALESETNVITTDKNFNPRGLKMGDVVTWANPENHEATDRFKITGVEGRFGSKVLLEPATPTTKRVFGSRSVNMFVKAKG